LTDAFGEDFYSALEAAYAQSFQGSDWVSEYKSSGLWPVSL